MLTSITFPLTEHQYLALKPWFEALVQSEDCTGHSSGNETLYGQTILKTFKDYLECRLLGKVTIRLIIDYPAINPSGRSYRLELSGDESKVYGKIPLALLKDIGVERCDPWFVQEFWNSYSRMTGIISNENMAIERLEGIYSDYRLAIDLAFKYLDEIEKMARGDRRRYDIIAGLAKKALSVALE